MPIRVLDEDTTQISFAMFKSAIDTDSHCYYGQILTTKTKSNIQT